MITDFIKKGDVVLFVVVGECDPWQIHGPCTLTEIVASAWNAPTDIRAIVRVDGDGSVRNIGEEVAQEWVPSVDGRVDLSDCGWLPDHWQTYREHGGNDNAYEARQWQMEQV
jgi:hypothetical protein